MTGRSLQAIRASLDEIPGTTNHDSDDQLAFDQVEEMAISILDSEHGDFAPGVLQEYLMSYLYIRQLEYGLVQFPDPSEA